jgi:DNA-binding beta-propeller fold protein YncE
VGNSPEGIAADPRTGLAVVSLRNPAQLVLLNLHTGRVVRRIPIRGPARHLQLARPGGPVLVPEEPVNTLLELALPSGRSSSTAVGAHPHDAAAAGPIVFVSDEFGRSISALKGTRVIAMIPGFVQPGGIAAVGSDVAVVDVRANSVTLIDANTLRVRGRLPAGRGPTHVVAGRGGVIYVLDTRGGGIFSYATRPALRLLGRLSLPGGPYGIAIDNGRGRLWVALTAKDELVELSTRGPAPSVLRSFPTGRQPNTLAVDPRTGRVLVADAGAGSVELIDPPAG